MSVDIRDDDDDDDDDDGSRCVIKIRRRVPGCNVQVWLRTPRVTAAETDMQSSMNAATAWVCVRHPNSPPNSLFESPFGGVRGNVCTSSIARWKARCRLPIRCNSTFYSSSYG